MLVTDLITDSTSVLGPVAKNIKNKIKSNKKQLSLSSSSGICHPRRDFTSKTKATTTDPKHGNSVSTH